MKMKIRAVKKRDLRKIIKVEKKIFQDQAFSKILMKELLDQSLLFHKLETNNLFTKLIGFIILIKDMKDRANLINFAIKPKYQGRGFGTFLLKNSLEWLRSNHSVIKKIILNVKTDNRRAIRLYEKCDFHIVKKIEKYYQNEEAAYLMELNL
jgi:ribosomal protein S18 acetylase RimI-like enzyme